MWLMVKNIPLIVNRDHGNRETAERRHALLVKTCTDISEVASTYAQKVSWKIKPYVRVTSTRRRSEARRAVLFFIVNPVLAVQIESSVEVEPTPPEWFFGVCPLRSQTF